MIDYVEAFRRLHPRQFPHSPFERQRELRDLWPADQAEFRAACDSINGERSDG